MYLPAQDRISQCSPPGLLLCVQVTEEELRSEFGAFGEIAGIKPCHKGGYGFVTFKEHSSAVAAIVGMNGKELKGKVSQMCYLITCRPSVQMPSAPSHFLQWPPMGFIFGFSFFRHRP